MKFKTPTFWYERYSPWQLVLEPASMFYHFAHTVHQAMGHAPSNLIPVICVGNITAGGSGKTPCAAAIMDLVKDNNLANNPCFLSRGYGSGIKNAKVIQTPNDHNAQIGDEAQILSKHAPVIISPDRQEGMLLAQNEGFDLIIMDDGLQNPNIKKDIQIIVINGEMGIGNGSLIPAGPLRTPWRAAFQKADIFIIIGKDVQEIRPLIPKNKIIINAMLYPENLPDRTKKYLAFTGLGYPPKFFKFLREDCGLTLTDTVEFPDHHPYSHKDINDLKEKANFLDAELITTEKDYNRLPQHAKDTLYVPVSLNLNSQDHLIKTIKNIAI